MEKLTMAESRLMQIIWEKKEIGSGDLVKEAEKRLSWKKSTTYTILKKLTEKQLAANENSWVRALVTNEEYYQSRRKDALDRYFDGSLPEFLVSFFREETLTRQQVEELEKLIQDYKEEHYDT